MQAAEVLKILEGLIQTLEDGKTGFRQAAVASKDPELARALTELSEQRAELSAQMQTLGAVYGESAYDQETSVAGALHRGWIDLKAAIASDNAHGILAECERGEDHAVAEFRQAIEHDLPSNVREVVERQAAVVEATHDHVKRLRDLAKAAHA